MNTHTIRLSPEYHKPEGRLKLDIETDVLQFNGRNYGFCFNRYTREAFCYGIGSAVVAPELRGVLNPRPIEIKVGDTLELLDGTKLTVEQPDIGLVTPVVTVID